MRFHETTIAGAYVIEPEKIRDERGFFARVWCAEEFEAMGLCTAWVQSSISLNDSAGTLRGLHYQAAPGQEDKLVTCTAGAVFDVIADLRPGSASFRQWFGVELTSRDNSVVYVPKGVAHGFLTIEEASMVQYHMSAYHRPDLARGVRWDDPALAIRWPATPSVMSARDRAFADLEVGE